MLSSRRGLHPPSLALDCRLPSDYPHRFDLVNARGVRAFQVHPPIDATANHGSRYFNLNLLRTSSHTRYLDLDDADVQPNSSPWVFGLGPNIRTP